MQTRCKFQVEKVTKYAGSEAVTLNAVTGGSPENVSFSQYTPNGKLEISVTNPNVIGTFEPGAYYYLDLVPAEK